MRTIWKYPINLDGPMVLHVGQDAKVVHVGLDPHQQPCVWVEHEPDDNLTPLHLSVIGTGHPVPEGQHVGSVQDGIFVWHVYA